ncbi:uncharacterized protein TNIN_416941 [Trichonephila inaurata madagascariensis]|uniref:Uncharacterized protein n=1 Tax=Trichonephila inaurata madagascariensis TaxID=2747483 RepID=A0A8X7BTC5_9ARAC|nr:uncharacterized protein TNIN_416941 [Trichonephila inaurata madagascariensis]
MNVLYKDEKVSKYSNLEKVLRITAWKKRFIKMLKKSNVLDGPLTSEELSEAERFWIQVEQEEFFPEEFLSKIKKYLAKPIDQLTPPLPSDHINQTPAFLVCGLDFTGPLYVNNFGELQKSYIVLFTCGVTKALHLELVSDVTTNSFLLAFRRFLERRGN